MSAYNAGEEEVKSLGHVRLFATPWTVAHQAPLFMEFSRQEYWRGLPFPSPGDPPDPGIEPGSPTLWADTVPSELPGKSYNAGDPGSTPGLRRSPGEGNGNPLQHSCLENPMDGGAWWATVHGAANIGHDWATSLSLLCHVLFDSVVSFGTHKFLFLRKFEFLEIVALYPVFAYRRTQRYSLYFYTEVLYSLVYGWGKS